MDIFCHFDFCHSRRMASVLSCVVDLVLFALLLIVLLKFLTRNCSLVKSKGLYLRPSKSSQDPVVVMKFEFCAHSARLLRKLDHVFLRTLSKKVKKISTTKAALAMFCLYTLPLARPAQAKIQI